MDEPAYPPMTDNMLTLCVGILRDRVRHGNNNAEVADRAILGFLLQAQAKRVQVKQELPHPMMLRMSPREIEAYAMAGEAPHVDKLFDKLEAQRVKLNRDGYDDMGSYWGVGEPLWYVTTEDGSWSTNVRAMNMQTAIIKARAGRAK